MKRKLQSSEDISHVTVQKFLRLARRMHPTTVAFRDYIDEVNVALVEDHRAGSTVLKNQNPTLICLDTFPGGCDPAFTRLLDGLYVAFPYGKRFPPGVLEGIGSKNIVTMDQTLQGVIYSCLRKHSSPYDAREKNVLCNGFSLGSPYGQGSVLRDLDLRSPSTQIQMLRSPSWACLLSRIGHVLLRHLLANCILLISLEESEPDKAAHRRQRLCPKASVFLQVCGPSGTEGKRERKNSLTRRASNIVLKQDLLYHTPTSRKSTTPSLQKTDADSLGIPEKQACPKTPQVVYNSGLPKSHHLQGLSCDPASAKRLLAVVFQRYFCSLGGDSGPALDKRASCKTKNQAESMSSLHGDDFVLEWENSRIPTDLRLPARGRLWLKRRKPQHRRLCGLLPILQKVIKRTRLFAVRRILGRCCRLPASFRQEMRKGVGTSPKSWIAMSSRPKDVANFLVVCSRHLIPTNLIGSQRNRFVLEKGIHGFVRHRLKREKFSIRRLCSQNGLALSDIEWFHGKRLNRHRRTCNPADLKFRTRRVEELFSWLFRGLLLPLLQQNFHVTDTDRQRNKILFFRRELWVQMVDIANDNILRADKKFTILSKESLAECALRRRTMLSTYGRRTNPHPVLVYHHLRFVPKSCGMRGIQRPRGKMLRGFSMPSHNDPGMHPYASCSKDARSIPKAMAGTRRLFKLILRVLISESRADKSRTGASVFSLDDVYERMLFLKRRWKECGRPKIFACTVDITTSFDTVPLETLFLDVIPPLLTRERYAFFRYRVSKIDTARGKYVQRYLTHVCREPGEETSFVRAVRDKLAAGRSGAVFTDLVHLQTLSREEILGVMREFLANNVVAVPKRSRRGSETGYARQCRGLPQGHPLSSLLTSLLYAYVEQQDFSRFVTVTSTREQPGGVSFRTKMKKRPPVPKASANLLMRQVDDFIFITTSEDEAVQFLGRMKKGWKASHGFCVNAGKTQCNFSTGPQNVRDNIELAWCGLQFSTDSLQVTSDYRRYGQLEKGRMRHALYIEHDERVGTLFAERAQACFKPRLHALLLDSQINSRSTVALNIYQAALLACLKLCSYAVAITPDEVYLTKVVQMMVTKFVALTRSSISSRIAIANGAKLPLSSAEVRYLTLHAFQNGLRRKLGPRGKMAPRVKQCQLVLDSQVNELKLLLQQRDISTIALAHRICNNLCSALWAVNL